MEASSQIWLTIFGFIGFSIIISIVTHFWIRHHLKNKANAPSTTAEHSTNPSENK